MIYEQVRVGDITKPADLEGIIEQPRGDIGDVVVDTYDVKQMLLLKPDQPRPISNKPQSANQTADHQMTKLVAAARRFDVRRSDIQS